MEDPNDADEAHVSDEEVEEPIPEPALGRGQRKKKVLERYGLELHLWESK